MRDVSTNTLNVKNQFTLAPNQRHNLILGKYHMEVYPMLTRLIVVIALTLTSASSFAEIAKVNNRTITNEDLQSALSGFNETQAKSISNDSYARRQLLNNLIDQELLVQKAETQKLEKSKEYQQALDNFRKQYLANLALEKNLGSKVSDSAAKSFYNAHKTDFSTDQVHAYHILTDSEAKAKELLKEASKPNADFLAIAEKQSKDPSAKNNRGDLGYFPRDRMSDEFSEPVFRAKKDQIIGPIKTSFGYHVVKVVDIKVGNTPKYPEVELQVKNKLRQSLIHDFIVELRKTAKIEIKDPALK